MLKEFLVGVALGLSVWILPAHAGCLGIFCDDDSQQREQQPRDDEVGIGPNRRLDQSDTQHWGQFGKRGDSDRRDDQGVGIGPHRRLNSEDPTHWGQWK